MNSAEWMSLWYLRLNGYFTIPNFWEHGRRGPLTEIDVVGVRFPHSYEHPFQDDPQLQIPRGVIDFVLVEAKKSGQIEKLNDTWGKPEMLEYVLRRVGVVSDKEVNELARNLCTKTKVTGKDFTIRVLAFAQSIAPELKDRGVTFINWQQVLKFVNERFRKYEALKKQANTWDEFGQYLLTKLGGRTPPDVDALFAGWETCGRSHRTNRVPPTSSE